MKITVRKATNNDSKVWFVDYTPPGGKRRRISFETRALAEAHAEGLRSQESQAGEIWLALDARERSEVVSGWEQDCLRHTFASHYLPVFGAEKTIEALGHGDYDTLFQHYRTLVTPREAGAYWDELTPTIVCSAMIDDLGDAPTLAIAGRN